MSAAASAVAATKTTQATAEPAGETDEEFLARMEAEDAASFQEALMEWRTDKAAGGGQAKVVEAGGAFTGEPMAAVAEEEQSAAAPAAAQAQAPATAAPANAEGQ